MLGVALRRGGAGMSGTGKSLTEAEKEEQVHGMEAPGLAKQEGQVRSGSPTKSFEKPNDTFHFGQGQLHPLVPPNKDHLLI